MAADEPLSMRTVFKFILPFMGIFMTSVLLWGNDHKVWAVFPTLLIALYLSAAEIRMEDKHVYYRYFFSWKKLPDDISDVRCTLLPALGYIRFKHFLPPLGILFFIVERGHRNFVPFRRIDSLQKWVSFSDLRHNKWSVRIDSHAEGSNVTRKARLARAFYPVAGMLVGMLMPVPWQHWTPPTNWDLISLYMYIIQQYPPVLYLYVGLSAVLIIRNKLHNFVNFGLAFSIGTIIAHLAHKH